VHKKRQEEGKNGETETRNGERPLQDDASLRHVTVSAKRKQKKRKRKQKERKERKKKEGKKPRGI